MYISLTRTELLCIYHLLITRNITYSNRPDHVAQLAEHWASIPKVVGSIRAYFSSSPGVDIHSE